MRRSLLHQQGLNEGRHPVTGLAFDAHHHDQITRSGGHVPDHIDVRIHFDRDVPDEGLSNATFFVELLEAELLGGARDGGAWGMGRALVTRVDQLVNDGFGRLLPKARS